ncbi:MAG: hypothetical protein AAGF72_03275 [Pseudomonadota bacterium]
MVTATLILNALWFAGGFHLFWLRGRVFAKVVVPREHRDTPVFETLVRSGTFLGGFNLAFCVLNVLLLANLQAFDSDRQWAILLLVNALAHGSQFAGNVPIALENRRGHGAWKVFSGLMLLIFVVDFTLMALNAGLALGFLT